MNSIKQTKNKYDFPLDVLEIINVFEYMNDTLLSAIKYFLR